MWLTWSWSAWSHDHHWILFGKVSAQPGNTVMTVMTNSWPPGPESQDIHSIMPQTLKTKRKQISLFLRNNPCRPRIRSVLFPFFSTISISMVLAKLAMYLNLNIDSDSQRLLFKKYIIFFQISHNIPIQVPATAWSAPWLTADSGRSLTGSLGSRRSSATSSTACPPPSDKAPHTHQHFILVIVFQKIIINLKLIEVHST